MAAHTRDTQNRLSSVGFVMHTNIELNACAVDRRQRSHIDIRAKMLCVLLAHAVPD
jgi:hypothetical protein